MKFSDNDIEIKEYALSSASERLDAMFYMQTSWINIKGKLMDIADDFYLDFIKLLNKHNVEYLLIGGFAVNYYGYPRTTHDMDLWANNDPSNSKKLLNAIDDFGFDVSVLQGVYLKNNEPIKLPHDTISFKKIEILADISGVFNFNQAYQNKIITDYNNVQIPFIGYNELIKNKLASGRTKDIDDIETLKRVQAERQNNTIHKPKSNTLRRKL